MQYFEAEKKLRKIHKSSIRTHRKLSSHVVNRYKRPNVDGYEVRGTGYGVLEIFRGWGGSKLSTCKTLEYYFKCFLRMRELRRRDNVGINIVVVVIQAVLYLYVGNVKL
jgi:hypothetical protein